MATYRASLRPFLDFSRLGDAIGQIQILHEAANLLGLGDMGPQIPMVSSVKAKFRDDLEAATVLLLGLNDTVSPKLDFRFIPIH